MKERDRRDPDISQLLQAWPALAPDPRAMDRVAGRMATAVAAVRAQMGAEELQFRLLCSLWAAVALSAYLARWLLVGFFALHPGWALLLGLLALLCLLAPLLLVPILRTEDLRADPSKGGASTC